MPSSHYAPIVDIIKLMIEYSPSSILDVGCGFGRWGFLAREFLDIQSDRYFKNDWKIKIDAVEIFQKYITKHHEYIYDNIFIENVESFVNKKIQYELIIAGDVIEHFDKNKGIEIIKKLYSLADKALICMIPIGDSWSQGDHCGNTFEKHLSIWNKKDIRRLKGHIFKIYKINSAPYALVIWSDYYMKSSLIKRFGIRIRNITRKLLKGKIKIK